MNFDDFHELSDKPEKPRVLKGNIEESTQSPDNKYNAWRSF